VLAGKHEGLDIDSDGTSVGILEVDHLGGKLASVGLRPCEGVPGFDRVSVERDRQLVPTAVGLAVEEPVEDHREVGSDLVGRSAEHPRCHARRRSSWQDAIELLPQHDSAGASRHDTVGHTPIDRCSVDGLQIP
jgi:hypothetical protein